MTDTYTYDNHVQMTKKTVEINNTMFVYYDIYVNNMFIYQTGCTIELDIQKEMQKRKSYLSSLRHLLQPKQHQLPDTNHTKERKVRFDDKKEVCEFERDIAVSKSLCLQPYYVKLGKKVIL